jgi:predicted DCC family thiol-disulfide oxidoreductase YuxK
MNNEGAILLFDGECNLCDNMVNFIISHDTSKSITFSALQSDAGRSLLEKSGLSRDYMKSVVYIRGNKHFIRSSAVLNILRDLGGGWSLFYGLVIIPSFIRDFFYNIFGRLRHRIFGRKVHCYVNEHFSQKPEARSPKPEVKSFTP